MIYYRDRLYLTEAGEIENIDKNILAYLTAHKNDINSDSALKSGIISLVNGNSDNVNDNEQDNSEDTAEKILTTDITPVNSEKSELEKQQEKGMFNSAENVKALASEISGGSYQKNEFKEVLNETQNEILLNFNPKTQDEINLLFNNIKAEHKNIDSFNNEWSKYKISPNKLIDDGAYLNNGLGLLPLSGTEQMHNDKDYKYAIANRDNKLVLLKYNAEKNYNYGIIVSLDYDFNKSFFENLINLIKSNETVYNKFISKENDNGEGFIDLEK